MTQPSARICILGGGFGGLYTALYLHQLTRRSALCPQITLVDQKPRFLFTPLLYEQLVGELETWEIAPPFTDLLANTSIQFQQDVVETVNLEQRQVLLRSGDHLAYDFLVLAVGQQTQIGDLPGASTYALPFRTLADSDRLNQKLRSLRNLATETRLAIVGAGPNGVELACKLADRLHRQASIHLIDRGNTLLQSFSAATQRTAYQALASRNVQIHLNSAIESIEAERIWFNQNEQRLSLPVDLVLWTTGTKTWDWIRSLDCPHTTQGQLMVYPTLQLMKCPEVFVVGDLAACQDAADQSIGATAQTAFQQAKTAAANLHACLHQRPLSAFRYQHQGEMLTLGMGTAVVATDKAHLEGRLATLIRQWAYLMRLPTLRHRLRVIKHRLVLWVSQRWNWMQHWVMSQFGQHRSHNPRSQASRDRNGATSTHPTRDPNTTHSPSRHPTRK